MRHARKTLLGELLRIEHGWAFKGEYFQESGHHLVLTPGNFTARDGLRLRPAKDRYYGAEFPPKFLLSKGDLIVAMTDLTQNAPILGAPAFVPEDGRYLHNQRLGLVLVEDRVADRRFVYYLLQLDSVRSQIRATATGATVRHTAPSRIAACEVELPDLAEQQHLAGVLGAYDDLIAANERRMVLLEESVRLLYREWFERLRFPGHEWTATTDSLPNGWSNVPLATVADVNPSSVNRRSPPSTIRYVDISSLGTGRMAPNEEIPWSEAPSRAQRLASDGDVLWAMVRPANRAYAIVDTPPDNLVVSTGIAVLSPRKMPTSYLYAVTTTDAFVAQIANVATGASYPAAKPGDFADARILLPSPEILDSFDAFAGPRFRLIATLGRQNAKLREARDYLLPRLMSGQLSA